MGYETNMLEQPVPGARIRGHIDHANLLAGGQAAMSAILGDLVGEADLAARQKQYAPFARHPAFRAAPGSGLACAVRQHVSNCARRLRVDLRQLVKAK